MDANIKVGKRMAVRVWLYPMEEKLSQLEEEMSLAAESLEFERAAELRDQILILKEKIK